MKRLLAKIRARYLVWKLCRKGHCPLCGMFAFKAIYAGLPLRMCSDDQCCCAWGPGTWAMSLFSNGEGWALMPYEGSYLRALWHWVRHS